MDREDDSIGALCGVGGDTGRADETTHTQLELVASLPFRDAWGLLQSLIAT